MHPAAATKPIILHSLPGRLRLHLPARQRPCAVVLLRQLTWVRHVELNPLTGNLLVCYDPGVPATRLVNLLAATEGDSWGRRRRCPAARTAPDGEKADAVRRAVGSLRWGLEAVQLLTARKGAVVAAGLAALAPAATRLALAALLGRDGTDFLGLLADCAAALLAGAPLALALAAAEAVLWLACRATASDAGPAVRPHVLAA